MGEWLPSGSIELEHDSGRHRGAHERGAHERGAHEAPTAFDESRYVQQRHPHFGDPPQLPPEYTPRTRARRTQPEPGTGRPTTDTDRASLTPEPSGWDTARRTTRGPDGAGPDYTTGQHRSAPPQYGSAQPYAGPEQYGSGRQYDTERTHDTEPRYGGDAQYGDGRQYNTGDGRQYNTGAGPRYDDYSTTGRRQAQPGTEPDYGTGPSRRQYPTGPSRRTVDPGFPDAADYGTGAGPRHYDSGADRTDSPSGYGQHSRGIDPDPYGSGPSARHSADPGRHQAPFGSDPSAPDSGRGAYGTGPSRQQYPTGPSKGYDEAATDIARGSHSADDDLDPNAPRTVGYAASPADIHPTDIHPEGERPDDTYYRKSAFDGTASDPDGSGGYDADGFDTGYVGGRGADRFADERYGRDGSARDDDRHHASAAGFGGAAAVGAARFADTGDGNHSPPDRPFDGFAPTNDDRDDDAPPPSRADTRRAAGGGHRAAGRRRRGRILAGGAAAVALVAVLVLGWLAFDRFFGGPGLPEDYVGSGGDSVIIRVNPGDTADRIATAMADQDVVASAAAFFNAAVQQPAMSSVQPGYYELTTRIPAAQAVSELIDPTSRVGNVVIAEGRQLIDTRDVNTASVRKGIYTLLSEATCAAGIRCLTPEDFRAAGASTDLEGLSVPSWAIDRVRAVPEADRQLEGLIAAGSWDIDPSADATTILSQLVAESVQSYESTGLLTAGAANGLSPYDTLVAASLVERESLPADFAKVARVIVNRLAIGQYLEFDSTVNYALADTEVATTDADRARVTPWNTYASPGLPQTPICSPSLAAVQAMEAPEPGDWLYFVTINTQGETLFTNSYAQHLANIQLVEPGFLASGR